MFITLARSDTIRVAPQYLTAGGGQASTDLETILSQEIDIKYADTVLPGYGLVLCLWAVDEIKDATVMPGDGGAYTFVRFRLLVFCPEPNEVVVAKVKAVDPKGGVRCSVDFFMDIVVPPHMLPDGATYNSSINGYSMPHDPNDTNEAPDFRVDDYVRIKVSSVLYRAAKGTGATGGPGDGGSTAPTDGGRPGLALTAQQQAQAALIAQQTALYMLDVAGAAAAAASASSENRFYEPKSLPAAQGSGQPIMRPGVLVVGSSTTDGALLPTPATVPGQKVLADASTALVPSSSSGAAGAAVPRPIGMSNAPFPPSYSMAPPPDITKPQAAELIPVEARLKYSLGSSQLICPPLGQAFTSAATSTWRLETGLASHSAAAPAVVAAGKSKKDKSSSSNNVVLAAAAAALRHGATNHSHLPDYLKTAEPLAPAIAAGSLGAQRRLTGPAGVERFYTRDAVSNVLLATGVMAGEATGEPSSSSGASGPSPLMVAGGPAGLLGPFLAGGTYNPPMAVVASMRGSGLGPLGWWEGDDGLDYLPLFDFNSFEQRADGTRKYKVAEDAVTRVGRAFGSTMSFTSSYSGSSSSSSSSSASAAAPSVEPLDQAPAATAAGGDASSGGPAAKRPRKADGPISQAAASAESAKTADSVGEESEAEQGDGGSNSTASAKRGGRGGWRGARGGRGGKGK